jgi:fatty acid desaturase
MKHDDLASPAELKAWTEASDRMGWRALALDWAMILGALALAGAFPSVLTALLAIVVVGGRQLGLAILMHEAAHRSLFRTRWLNDVVGQTFAASPVWLDLARYRKHHLAHHAFTNTERDPDLGLVEPFPTTPASLARKFLRDLTGIASLKRVAATLLMDFEVLTYTASGGARRGVAREEGWLGRGLWRVGRFLASQVVLLAVLSAFGIGWTYLLWLTAFMTTFSLFFRVRAIAEHACTERTGDMRRNTRTTLAGPLAWLTVAPHGVNYHLEHHLFMSVPYFRLPEVHRTLRDRGALDDSPIARSYAEVLRVATSRRR